MKWKTPPKIKIYEALGAVADKRIEITDNKGKVFSSSKKKFYSIEYNKDKNAIMSNDNGSYWKSYLGYPSIAFLMLKGKITFNSVFAEALKDIPWKDINVKFKNDYEKTEQYILEKVREKGFETKELLEEINGIYEQVRKLDMELLGKKTFPPKGY